MAPGPSTRSRQETLNPSASALLLQKGHVSLTLAAEAKVVADHHMPQGQAFAQHLPGEIFCGELGQGSVEPQHEEKVDTERLNQTRLEAKRRQAERRRRGIEVDPWVRLEAEHGMRQAELAGEAPGPWR